MKDPLNKSDRSPYCLRDPLRPAEKFSGDADGPPPKDISKQHELENRAVSDIIDKPKSAARVSNNRVSYDVALNNT